MIKRLAGVLSWIVLVLVWVLLLWFVLPVDLAHLSPAKLAAWHFLPPLGAGLCIHLFRHYLKWKKSEATAAHEAREQVRRQNAREEARLKYEAAMRERQFNCHCRGLWVQASEEIGLADVFPGAAITSAMPGHASEAYLQPLVALYKQCPGALAFPLYLMPPADAIAKEVMEDVKRGIQPVVEALYWEHRHMPHILFAPRANHAADSALSIFEQNDDLPGAVILAFDSPLERSSKAQGQEEKPEDDAEAEHAAAAGKRQGKPAGGATALLLTHPALDDLLSKVAHIALPANGATTHDALTPYWERNEIPKGNLSMLAALTRQERDQLQALPVLACIHRSRALAFEKGWRPLQRTQHLQFALEQALISAGLLAFPFTFSPDKVVQEKQSEADEPASITRPPPLSWLVHNAGGVEHAAERMTDFGGALSHLKLDLNPVSEATNTSAILGDWGEATPWVLLAGSIAKSSALQAAVLCANYSGNRDGAIAVAIPASLSNTFAAADCFQNGIDSLAPTTAVVP